MADDIIIPSYYTFLTDKGIVVADTSTVLQDVQNEWKERFGTTISVDASTPQGRIMEMSAADRKGYVTVTANIINQLNPNYATGQFLDALGAFFDLQRKAATRTVALCLLTGEISTLIPAGSQARTEAGDIFFSANDVYIGRDGTATQYFYSVEAGEVPCALNTLTDILTPVVGWNSIVNNLLTAITIGSKQESDTDFRARILAGRYHGAALPDAIRSALIKLPDVNGVAVFNNGKGTSDLWGTVSVPPHSVCIVVAGGDDTQIAQTIFDTMSCGCGFTQINDDIGVTVDVPFETGGLPVNQQITFNHADDIALDCEVRVGAGKYTGTSTALREAIINAVADWSKNLVAGVDGIKIGVPVYPFEIAAAISAEIPEIVMQSVGVCASGGTISPAPYTPPVYGFATIASTDITVYVDGVEVVGE